jgi:hypothetical protein
MSQQDQWQAYPSYSSMSGKPYPSNIGADDSSTFVHPLHVGSSQSCSPYTFSPDTAMPPPPPGMYSPGVSQLKSNTRYQLALVVLLVLVVVLGSLELVQVAAHTPMTTYLSGSAGSNQTGTTSDQHATTPQKASPGQLLTPGTIKENITLTCSGCNDPVLTTINSITIDTTNHRVIITVTLHNVSGAQQIDYFADFSLQDPFGNTYEGTGELNTDFFLAAGQSGIKTEIFSFLPYSGTSYMLITRLGIAGITYDSLQLTF